MSDDEGASIERRWLLKEIELLRQVVQFADGYVVARTADDEHQMVLLDLYNPECEAAGAIRRAGCHPRGRFRSAVI